MVADNQITQKDGIQYNCCGTWMKIQLFISQEEDNDFSLTFGQLVHLLACLVAVALLPDQEETK